MFLVCFNVMIVKSENIKTNDSLIVLKIVNAELKTIIDSLLIHEKEMGYYDSNLVFYIDVQNRNSVTLVSIGSFHKIMKTGNEIGCFTVDNHIFIVTGKHESILFKKTRCKKRIDFYVPLEETENDSENIIIDIYEDDFYTQWDYRLVKGELKKIP